MVILAARRINKIDISNTLNDSLKYKSSFMLSNFPLPKTIPITTTAKSPDSCANISDMVYTNNTVDNETTLSK